MNVENTMMTADRDGRPLFLLRTNSSPDVWIATYTDAAWDGGWFQVS